MSGYSHLTAEERDRLADLRAEGLSLRAIARALGRAVSTISRELDTRINSLFWRGVRMIGSAAAGLAAFSAASA